MKIYFCDGCNESIPLADVQDGQVTTIKGRLFCRTCIPPGVVSGPAVAEHRGRSPARVPALLWLALLGLIGWTAWRDRALLLGDTPQEPAPLTEPAPGRDLAERLRVVEHELFEVRESTSVVGRDLAGLQAGGAELRTAVQAGEQVVAALDAEVQRLSIAQAATAQLVERVQAHANRLASAELRLDTLGQAVAGHDGALARIGAEAGQQLAADPQAPAMLAAGMGTPDVAPPDPKRAAAIDALRRQLLDPDADRRFEAVAETDRGNYRELAPELLKLLEDDDIFVRIDAMNVLGNFGHEPAVPALFDVLEDANTLIRKSAAETLVRLTGFDPGFDHNGPATDRGRAVKSWREWYEQRGA